MEPTGISLDGRNLIVKRNMSVMNTRCLAVFDLSPVTVYLK